MEETYELNVCNILVVLEQQLATSEFDGKFDYIPYQEFDPQGDRVWSNLMSGQWAYQQAVCMPFVLIPLYSSHHMSYLGRDHKGPAQPWCNVGSSRSW